MNLTPAGPFQSGRYFQRAGSVAEANQCRCRLRGVSYPPMTDIDLPGLDRELKKGAASAGEWASDLGRSESARCSWSAPRCRIS